MDTNVFMDQTASRAMLGKKMSVTQELEEGKLDHGVWE
jgi:hypothetical protein